MELSMMGLRGRKKGANGERSRELLLEIAAEEFAQNGFYETRVSTIVKKAGVTQPTFYLYFTSKEAIFQELIDIFRSKLFELIKQSRLESGLESASIKGVITGRVTSILSFFKENPNITQIGLYIAKESVEIKEELALLIKENLMREQQEGYFMSDVDFYIVSDGLIGIIERLTLTKLLNGLINPEKLATEIVRLFLYGLLDSERRGNSNNQTIDSEA